MTARPRDRAPDLAILIALPEEFRSLAAEYTSHWESVPSADHPGHDFFFVGPNDYHCVAAVMPRMGPTVASQVSTRLLAWHPTTIINVGIAGSFKDDLHIGDVIVPSQVHAYDETGKFKDTRWEQRGTAYRPSADLVAQVHELEFTAGSAYSEWREKGHQRFAQLRTELALRPNEQLLAPIGPRDYPAINTRHLASGSFVVASKEFASFIRRANADIHAGEMEAAGMLAAAEYHVQGVKTLIVRGISDHVYIDKGEIDKVGHGALRSLAMANAWGLVTTLMRLERFARIPTASAPAKPKVPVPKFVATVSLRTTVFVYCSQVTRSPHSETIYQQMFALVDALARSGVDVVSDCTTPEPEGGWIDWLRSTIEHSAWVLFPMTEEMLRPTPLETLSDVGWDRLFMQMLADQSPRLKIMPLAIGGLPAVEPLEWLQTPHRLPDELERIVAEVRAKLPRSEGASSPTAHPGLAYEPSPEQKLSILLELLERQATDGQSTAKLERLMLDAERAIRRGPLPSPGDVLGRRYRLKAMAGSGGYATVWKAWDGQLRQIVALKILHSQWAQDKSRVERFTRGARKMKELEHPHIVPVFSECIQDGCHWFFPMQWMNNGDLDKQVKSGMISRTDALIAVCQAAEGLHFAHSHGLVHRDVKPSNILLQISGDAAISDFDLVRGLDTTHGTRSSEALGTFIYGAPEALEAAATVDHRADVYGLGMTTIFCLRGTQPPALIAEMKPEEIASLECSEALKRVLRQAVAYDVDKRLNSCEDLAEAIHRFINRQDLPSASPGRRPPRLSSVRQPIDLERLNLTVPGDLWLVPQVPDSAPTVYVVPGTLTREQGFQIGRETNCDLSIDHPLTSRNHATLRWRDGKLRITDNKSTNGTRVNGTQINEASVDMGAVLTFGQISFVVIPRPRDAPTIPGPVE